MSRKKTSSKLEQRQLASTQVNQSQNSAPLQLRLPLDSSQKPKSENFTFWLPAIAVGAGLSFLMLLVIGYSLSRPCVVGKCREIEQAKQLAQISTRNLQKPSAEEIKTSQSQLARSQQLLESIPPWSKYHSQAKTLLANHRQQLENLTTAIAALDLETKAKGQQNSASLWQSAIATWQTIPTDSTLYSFAQAQIAADQQKLLATQQQHSQEQEATVSLQTAQEAAKIAQARQSVAQSLANWQLVEATWETAIERLREIPPASTNSAQAQALLKEYQSSLAIAEEYTSREQFAENLYNQATNLAQQAQTSAANNQWSAAVSDWQKALKALQEVPENSFIYQQATASRETYTQSLKKAQVQLGKALTRQQASQDLQKICAGICSYAVKEQGISIRLNSAYTERVRQTALQAKVQGNTSAQVKLLDHISSLEEGLEAIAHNVDLPVEVYDAGGTKLITYQK